LPPRLPQRLACRPSLRTSQHDRRWADASKVADSATSTKSLNAADQNFIKAAAGAGLAEVEIGRLVAQKAQSDSVKRFAQHMIEDHSKANDELMAIAQKLNLAPPKQIPSEEQALQRKLSALEGPKLEQTYMESQLRAHQKAVQLFQHQATAGQNADLKKFAADTLPTLNQHLQMAQQVTADAGKGASKIEPAAGGKQARRAATKEQAAQPSNPRRDRARTGASRDPESARVTELNSRELQRLEGQSR
jgi:putative membrane protein